MFALSIERRHRVLKTTVSGIFSSEDIAGLDRAVLLFTARQGPTRGLIDFTSVDALAVPLSKLAERGRQPQIVADRECVMVMPRSACRELGRGFAEQQRSVGSRPPVIVDFIEEAYWILDLVDPVFEPVDGI